MPHQAHLPALVGDTHADAALGELTDCGLVSPVGSRYRLAAGVLTQLESAGYADDVRERALAAAQHYAWWAGHPSVTPERVCAEADAVLTALAVLDAGDDPPAGDEESTAVQLARTAHRRSPPGCTGAPGNGRCVPAPRPPGSPVTSRNRPTSTTNSVSSRCARATSTGPAPSWRPPSGCAARSPTSVAPSRAAVPSHWSPTGRGHPRPRRRRVRRAGAAAGLGVVGLGPDRGEEVPDARNESRRRRSRAYRALPRPPAAPRSRPPWSPAGRRPPGRLRKAGVGIKGFARAQPRRRRSGRCCSSPCSARW
ncbi:hypothetical protein LV779_01010 [Streptomyces thinghirensis]|nr:hypothetical protein [Streptomyces thinghirensis]